jgi:hypothetical protein
MFIPLLQPSNIPRQNTKMDITIPEPGLESNSDLVFASAPPHASSHCLVPSLVSSSTLEVPTTTGLNRCI